METTGLAKKQLESLTIHQFRGLTELALDDLGKATILFGPNNCGKTSVLEALSIYCHPSSGQGWLAAAVGRRLLVDPLARYLADPGIVRVHDVRWLFPQMSRVAEEGLCEGQIRLSSTGSFALRELSATCKENFPSWKEGRRDDTQPEVRFAESDEGAADGESLRRGFELDLTISHLPRPKDVQAEPVEESQLLISHEKYTLTMLQSTGFYGTSLPSLRVGTVSPWLHRVERSYIQYLSKAALAGYKEAVVRLLQEIDPDIRDLEILSPEGSRLEVYVHHAQSGLAPISTLGDGVRRALAIALILPSVKGGVLLIDEIEASLHVSALSELFKWILASCKRYDVQLFATTHSLEAVDAMIEASEDDLQELVGYRLNRSKDKCSAQRFAGEMLRRMRYERGLDVR